MRIAAEVVIDLHIDDVFEFVSEPLNDPRWCPKVLYVEQVEGDEPGLGAEYSVLHRPIPFRPPRRMRYACTEWDPPHYIAWHEDDGHDVIEAVYRLESVWTATRFIQVDTAELAGPRLLQTFVMAGMSRDLRRQLRLLKRVLERS